MEVRPTSNRSCVDARRVPAATFMVRRAFFPQQDLHGATLTHWRSPFVAPTQERDGFIHCRVQQHLCGGHGTSRNGPKWRRFNEFLS